MICSKEIIKLILKMTNLKKLKVFNVSIPQTFANAIQDGLLKLEVLKICKHKSPYAEVIIAIFTYLLISIEYVFRY